VRNLVETDCRALRPLDVAVNNAGTKENLARWPSRRPRGYAGMVQHQCAWHAPELKHELRVMQPQGSGSIINILRPWASAVRRFSALRRKQHAVEGLTKPPLSKPPLGCVSMPVAPGPTETAMLDRLTGTPKKEAFYAAIPL